MRRSMEAEKLRITYLNQSFAADHAEVSAPLPRRPQIYLISTWAIARGSFRRTSTAHRYQVGHIRLPTEKQPAQSVGGLKLP